MNENKVIQALKIKNELADNTFIIAKSLLKYYKERLYENEKSLCAAAEKIKELESDVKKLSDALYREESAHDRLRHEVSQHKSWGKQLY